MSLELFLKDADTIAALRGGPARFAAVCEEPAGAAALCARSTPGAGDARKIASAARVPADALNTVFTSISEYRERGCGSGEKRVSGAVSGPERHAERIVYPCVHERSLCE